MKRKQVLKVPVVDIRDQARAARALVDASGYNADVVAMQSFMSIFHPEVSRDKVRKMVDDVKANRKR